MSEQFVRAALAIASWGCETALDVGSGEGRYQAFVRHCETIDPGQPAPAWSAYHYTDDALTAFQWIHADRYDLVYCLDVIEHMEKEDGLRLLAELERVAVRRILLFTPNGFRPQDSDDPWQVHRSGWTADELRGLGYTTAVVDFTYELKAEPAAALWAWRDL